MSSAGWSRRRRWLAVGVVACAILLASVVRLPGGGDSLTGPMGLVGLDKWIHALAYAALAAALAFALQDSARSDIVVIVAVLVATIAYGLAVELLQASIPYRSFDFADVLADGAGAAAVVLAWRAIVRVGRRGSAVAPP